MKGDKCSIKNCEELAIGYFEVSNGCLNLCSKHKSMGKMLNDYKNEEGGK